MPLTDHQELAAESRGGARLVSAAAAPAKQRVLGRAAHALCRPRRGHRSVSCHHLYARRSRRAAQPHSLRARRAHRRRPDEPPSPGGRRSCAAAPPSARSTASAVVFCARTHTSPASRRTTVSSSRTAPTKSASVCSISSSKSCMRPSKRMRAYARSWIRSARETTTISSRRLFCGCTNRCRATPTPMRGSPSSANRLTRTRGSTPGDTPWGPYLLSRIALPGAYWAGSGSEELRAGWTSRIGTAKIQKGVHQ